MHVLLPPSETKRTGGAGRLALEQLAHAPLLGHTRAQVLVALETLSADEASATKALGLGTKSRDERRHNLVLETSGVMPAAERYTGVLYDALHAESLDPHARAWLAEHVFIQSALFGLIGAADEIPAYRVSAGSRLHVDGVPLKRQWQSAHDGIEWPSPGWILDLRSKDYASLAPLPPERGSSLLIAQRGEDGIARALNHFNKAAKGDLVRRLAIERPEIHSESDFIDWGAVSGLDIGRPPSGELTLITDLRVGVA